MKVQSWKTERAPSERESDSKREVSKFRDFVFPLTRLSLSYHLSLLYISASLTKLVNSIQYDYGYEGPIGRLWQCVFSRI